MPVLVQPGLVPYLAIGVAAVVFAAAAFWAARAARRLRRAEHQRLEAEARIRALSGFLHEAVVAYARDRQITFANRAFEALTGYSMAELRDRQFLEHLHPEDRPLLAAEWDRLDRGETIDAQEYRIVTRAGQVKWASSSWRPLLDDREEIVGYFGTELDITERKQTEHELRRDLELFQTVMEVQQSVVAVGLDSRAVMSAIADRAHRFTHADAALIELVEGEGLATRVDTGAPAGAPRADTTLSSVCVRTGEVQRSDDTSDDRRVDPEAAARLGIRSLLAVPLTAEGRVLGVLKVISGKPHAFSERDVRALRMMAGLMGAALEHAAFLESRQARLEERTNALQESEQRFKHLVDAAQEGICVLDERDVTTYLNQRMAELLDHPIGEVLGRSLYEFMDAGARAGARAALARRSPGSVARLDVRFRRADGGDIWAMVAASPIERKDGTAVGTVMLVTDVTERRLAEERLRRSADRLAMLHDIDHAVLAARSPVEIARAALGRLRRIVPGHWASVVLFDHARDQAQILAGYEQDRSVPAARISLADFGPAELRRRGVVQCVAELAAVEDPPPRQRQLLERGIRSLLAAPLLAQGEVLGEIAVGAAEPGAFDAEHREIVREVAAPLAMAIQHANLRDELIRRTAEHDRQLAERSAAARELGGELDRVIGGLAHEVQAPIRQIHGFTSLLAEEAAHRLSEGGRHTAERIRQASLRLGALVEDLIALARIGREEVLRQRADVGAIAQEVVASLGGDEGGRRIAWEIGRLGAADCDPALVKTALAELASNAVKFTRTRSEPRIRIERVALENNGGEAGIVVRDNGVGFEPGGAERLFDMFARLHRPDEFEGSGLGLALVRRIAEKHGGRAWAESEPGRGSSFYVTLGTGWRDG
ncbi:MAG TPA: PAS domain S-box protein [Gemmatimonadales bacterium]|nr:PAS domain S-box protein [Gemmatimonadales bacterium]